MLLLKKTINFLADNSITLSAILLIIAVVVMILKGGIN